jgi:hypothetical protein
VFGGSVHTTGIVAHTWVPWSGIMVKRTTSYSRRIQHTLPREARDAVSSNFVNSEITLRLIGLDLLEKVLLSLNCVLNRMIGVDGGGTFVAGGSYRYHRFHVCSNVDHLHFAFDNSEQLYILTLLLTFSQFTHIKTYSRNQSCPNARSILRRREQSRPPHQAANRISYEDHALPDPQTYYNN